MIGSVDLLVLCAHGPARLARFYQTLGMEFRREKHGMGPEHHFCTIGNPVLEIYPVKPGGTGTRDTRIGFIVDSIQDAMSAVLAADGIEISAPKQTPWGRRALIQDPEGHKVELVER